MYNVMVKVPLWEIPDKDFIFFCSDDIPHDGGPEFRAMWSDLCTQYGNGMFKEVLEDELRTEPAQWDNAGNGKNLPPDAAQFYLKYFAYKSDFNVFSEAKHVDSGSDNITS